MNLIGLHALGHIDHAASGAGNEASVSAAGFCFGNAISDARRWQVVHFAFAFYGFAPCSVLLNPRNPVMRSVLAAIVESGDYFFLALEQDRHAMAFRPDTRAATWLG
jgi:hypothetical protein